MARGCVTATAGRRDAAAARVGIHHARSVLDALVSGYQRCVDLLSQPRSSGPLTQQFEMARVRAEVAFGIRQGTAPAITLTQDPARSDELIFGQALLELERQATAVGVTLTLIAPGYVLAARAKDAFVERVQRVAHDVAREFDDGRTIDYEIAIKQPSNPREIVVLLATDHPDDPFTYLVTWPVRTSDGERHFVFRCVEDGDSLDDIEPLLRASDRLGAASMADAPAALAIDEASTRLTTGSSALPACGGRGLRMMRSTTQDWNVVTRERDTAR